LKLSDPPDACEQLVEVPSSPISNNVCAVLATESGCDLHTKMENAQGAGFKHLVIMSNSEEPRVMDILPEHLLKYKIQVCFIGHRDGQDLKQFAVGGGTSTSG